MLKSLIYILLIVSYVADIMADVRTFQSDPDDDFLARDRNKDGKVSRKEFVEGSQAQATDEAFACLDYNMDGYVTREERDSMLIKFSRSKLATLTPEQVEEWMTDIKCVPDDTRKYQKHLKAANLNGLALWNVGVRNPSLLRTEMKIDSPNVRRAIVHVRISNHNLVGI
jgi:hypothetical protein